MFAFETEQAVQVTGKPVDTRLSAECFAVLIK